MNETQPIQWFPGHMAKTGRLMEKNLKLVDAVAEVIDARIPASSRNPDLEKMIRGRRRVIVMNKSDLADAGRTKEWLDYFGRRGEAALAVDCRSGKGLGGFEPLVRSVLKEKIAGWERKGMKGLALRVMVVGIPNAGKSSLINRLSKGSAAAVEDRPGVTRAGRWFPVGKSLELFDTPGVLWPKFGDRRVGEHLAFTGAVKDEVLDPELLAARLLVVLRDGGYAAEVKRRYSLEEDLAALDGHGLLELVGRKRGMLLRGGEIDTLRAAVAVLDEFRGGRLGRVTLERADGG